jgi:signal transduction histidine kinase/CheY-like chemotaxis protein
MTVARGDNGGGVTVVEVNLKFVWDVITNIRVGKKGLAFVVDSQGALIAHPDISLVLQKKDFSRLVQVAALDKALRSAAADEFAVGRDLAGKEVLTAHAPIPALGWNVFVELPLEEALEPMRDALYRTGVLLLAGLSLSVMASMFLARRMVRPIRALQAGADEIGAGRLDHRIDVHTGDELESVADRFNSMTRQLRDSYEDLERKVQERTHALSRTNAELNDALAALEQTRAQLVVLVQERTAQQKIAESANSAKTRFLAAASHDLRQPITTIGLLGDLLWEQLREPDIKPLVDQLREATRATESLLVGLMDVSRLDAGVEQPDLQPVRLAELFDSLRANAQAAAVAKGLRLRFRAGHRAALSDPILLGRELRNLVDNAIRYTRAGGVLVAARPHGSSSVRIEVWDTGIGIEAHQFDRIFEEFYQVGNVARDRRLGTGLGLAIVQRTAHLLGHTVRLRSVPGRGSCFSIVLPAAACGSEVPGVGAALEEPLLGWCVWLVEDDAALHKALAARLAAWGADLRSWRDSESLLAELDLWQAPDALLTDVRLPGMDGLQLAQEVARRLACTDARLLNTVLISGDTDPAQLTRIAASGLKMLTKPFHMEELLDALLRRVPAGSIKP